MDITTLEELVRQYFACGIAKRTVNTYTSAQRRYLDFCQTYQIPPLPLSEVSVCLFTAFLAHQGLKSQSILVYLSGLRHLQVSAGLQLPQRADWPRLQYVLKGIAHRQPQGSPHRLTITVAIMVQLQTALPQVTACPYEASMVWAACCLGYFGFMRSGELMSDRTNRACSICSGCGSRLAHQPISA